MATPKISVEVVAALEGYKAGLTQANKITKDFADQIHAGFSRLSSPIESLGKAMLAVGAIAAGGSVFKSFVDATVESANETNKLTKVLGLTVEQASVLRTQLKLAGLSVDEYTGAAFKLDKAIRTNEFTLNRFGLATRDANGGLLNQQTLMQNAIAWLGEFRAGTDRNIAAQTIFGKGASELGGLLKLNAELEERAKKSVEAYGGETKESLQAVRQYKFAMQDLSIAFEKIKGAIGTAALPYLTKFAEWFASNGPTIVKNMKETTKSFVTYAFDLVEGLVSFSVTGLDAISKVSSVISAVVNTIGTGAGYIASIQGKLSEFKAWTGLGGGLSGGAPWQGPLPESAGTALLDRIRKIRDAMLAGKPFEDAGGPSDIGKGTRSGTGLVVDPKLAEFRKLQAEHTRLLAEDRIKAGLAQSQFDLDLGKKTNEQFLKDKLGFQEQLNVIELKAAAEKVVAAGNDINVRQKALNDQVKITQEAAVKIKEINHQIVMEARKDYLQLAGAINSALVAGFADAFNNISKGIDGLKAALTGFLNSMKLALNQFAAQTLVKSLFGANSGVGGAGGFLADLIPKFASGGVLGAGRWGIAGEAGPELIHGGSGGATVMPLGGFGNMNTINVDARGSSMSPSHVEAAVRAGMAQAIAMSPQAMSRFQSRFA